MEFSGKITALATPKSGEMKSGVRKKVGLRKTFKTKLKHQNSKSTLDINSEFQRIIITD